MALALLLVMALDSDLRERRVPNLLVLLAMVVGLGLNTVGPVNTGAGMFATMSGCTADMVGSEFHTNLHPSLCCLEWPRY